MKRITLFTTHGKCYLMHANTRLILLLLLHIAVAAQAQSILLQGYRYGQEEAPTGHEWESPEELALNKLQPHAWIFSFESSEAARRVLPYESRLWQSLDGTWKFHWAPDPAHRPADFYTATYDVSRWDDLAVPGCWNVQGIQSDGTLKYGIPIYCNQPVIFAHKVAVDDWRGGVMREPKEDWVTYRHRNEVGSYRRNFTIPTDWHDKEIYLNFDGVNSFFYLWVNGRYVGFSKNSRTTASFDVTRYIHPGENSVAVEVYRNSDGSFLEAQDMWRLPGIYRSVSLQAKPKTQIFDLIVRTTDLHKGVVQVEANVRNETDQTRSDLSLSYSIYQCQLWEDVNTPVAGLQNISQRIDPVNADSHLEMSTELTIPNAQWWSSEAPHRYVLVASLKDDSGKTLESVSTYFGIRQVLIRETPAEEDEFGLAGRYFYVNDKPIKLKGVNRQEINLATGNTITHEQITEEVMLMRRGNINHVRTSHYSNDPFWFYTCDKYGIYLEDEANIESHEYYYGKASLSHVAEFRNAHIARVMEAAHAHVNSPCVVIWSLGNEAGPGDNFRAAYAALHDFDPSRPVQYERNNDIVDMGSNQYPGIDWMREAVRGRMTDIKYPFHVSEYAHSMGNAGGNLEDYWAAIESTNFFCGAAIWDWVDQGLWNYTPDGTRYMAYGGDFGDKPNDRTFCMNGILFADHTPKPEFEEVKKVYQEWSVKSEELRVEVFNKHYFTPAAKVKLVWSLYKDGVQVAAPQVLADAVELPAPRERKCFVLPLDKASLDADAEYYVRLQFLQACDMPWAQKGYVQAEEEVLLQPATLKQSLVAAENLKTLHQGELTYQQSEAQIDIHGANFDLSFDNHSGTIARLCYSGQEYLVPGHGPQFNGYRSAVDNDNWEGPVSWIDNGLYDMQSIVKEAPTLTKHPDGMLEIQYDVQCQSPDADSLFVVYAKQIWYVYPDGSIELRSGLHACDPDASLARCGYAMKLDQRLDQYAYYGRGPRNNYADRCSGSMHALYHSTVAEMFEPFGQPQDMANREEVKWCALTDQEGRGVQFVLYPNDPAKRGCASVLPYSDLDLAYADHPYQLPTPDGTWLHLDAAVTGLGGNSCGQGGPLAEDCVTASDRTFGFMIRPLTKYDDQTLIRRSKVVSEFDEPLNRIAGIRQLNATTAEILTSDGGIITVDFYGTNLFRLFFDPSGKEMRNPTANPQAEILVQQPREARFAGITIAEDEKQVSVGSASTRIVFDRHTGLLKVYREGKEVVSQKRQADFSNGRYELCLHQKPEEYFYGGGVQNGRFSHRGQKIEIVNTNSWTDGGVTSPAPFYWSTAGYGVLCHTFAPGDYDFGKTEADEVRLTHDESYLDLFFFTGHDPQELLGGYYQLTGHPVLLPKFGFYEGHLNAYNRDYWRLADSTEFRAIRMEDGRYYKEAQKDNGGIRESLNGELENYQFSARGVVDRYAQHDMPLGWILPNDGYGAGYGQTQTLDGNIANLKSFGDHARSKGVEIGLWTQSNLHPIDTLPALLQRDIIKEVRDAGVRVLKTDVAWVGDGYSFGLNGISEVANIIPYYGHNARPMIITLDGWAGTQRYGAIWSGDQTGGKWEYIRFHIPTYIGAGLSGLGNITSDMDGIYGGARQDVQIRDFEWKTFTPMQLNMDGWGSNPKYPHALGEPAASINRSYLKWKSMLLPYTYACSHEAAVGGKPLMRAMFLEFPCDYTYGPKVCYQYMYGPSLLIAPVYQATHEDTEGNDIRNDIYLPQGQWIDYFNGDTYEVNDAQGVTLSNYDAPIWKLPVFVRPGAIIPMNRPNNNPSQIDRSQLIVEIYPSTEASHFLLYDDDGTTEAYLNGEYAKVEISQQLSAKGVLDLRMQPKELNYSDSYLQHEVALTLMINSTCPPRKVTCGKTKLREVHSEEELRNTPNSYFYNVAPALNRFATPGSEFAKLSITKNAQLWIHTEPVSMADEVNLKVEGVAFDQPARLTSKQGALAAPTSACVADSARTPYALTPSWAAVENADYYEIRFEGQLYTAIRDTQLLLSQLQPETTYSIELRAVNAEGVSPWTSLSAQTLESPFKYAISGITAETNGVGNDEHDVYRLFDFFTGGDIWFDTKEADQPYVVTMDLHQPQRIERMEYLPREGGGNGGIQECDIEISLDGENYTPCGSYTWDDDESTKTVAFEGNPEVRYIRLSITKSRGNYVAGREMLIFKTRK